MCNVTRCKHIIVSQHVYTSNPLPVVCLWQNSHKCSISTVWRQWHENHSWKLLVETGPSTRCRCIFAFLPIYYLLCACQPQLIFKMRSSRIQTAYKTYLFSTVISAASFFICEGQCTWRVFRCTSSSAMRSWAELISRLSFCTWALFITSKRLQGRVSWISYSIAHWFWKQTYGRDTLERGWESNCGRAAVEKWCKETGLSPPTLFCFCAENCSPICVLWQKPTLDITLSWTLRS